jgi:putative FmdB family regulatory protein
MPIYEYKCSDCGAEFEELVSLHAEKNPPCTSCGSEKVEKKLSVFGSLGAASGSCGRSGFS